MNRALWIIAGGVLAAGFQASGAMTLARPEERLVASGMAVLDECSTAIKPIGTVQILAARVGPIPPAAPNIAPVRQLTTATTPTGI